MKILFLTSSAPQSEHDSTAPFILTMAEDLQALGHQVTILAPHANGCAREETLCGVRIVRFTYVWPARLQKLTAGGSAMVKLRRKPWLALLLPLFVLGQAAALRRLLRAEPFSIIQSHWLLPQGLVAGLLARRYGCVHIAMAHGADVFGLQQPLWQWCKKQALARTKTVIANSSATATAVRALNAHIPIEIIPVGATLCETPLVTQAERSACLQPRVLCVGRLFEGKGQRYLLDAIAQLPECELIIVGSGPDEDALKAQARTLGIEARVRFKGALSHSETLQQMARADVLVAPSVQTKDGWREAQGNAIAEAMMAGIPVIAADCGGIIDAVIHEQTGLLVAQRDAAAIARAVRRLIDDPALAQQLAQAGRAHAIAHFNRYKSAKRIAVLYESATGAA